MIIRPNNPQKGTNDIINILNNKDTMHVKYTTYM